MEKEGRRPQAAKSLFFAMEKEGRRPQAAKSHAYQIQEKAAGASPRPTGMMEDKISDETPPSKKGELK